MDNLYIIASHNKNIFTEKLSAPFMEICNVDEGKYPVGYDLYDSSFVDNISYKNKQYCELSQLYSVWKSNLNFKMLGLGHYRRVLNFNLNFHPINYTEEKISERNNILNSMANLIPISDDLLFVSTPFNVGSILEQFKIFHPQLLDLFNYSFSIYDRQNNYFSGKTKNYFENNGQLFTCNMFYGPKTFVNEFCEKIFNLLFEIENNVPEKLDGYQSRWAGFFAERYLSFFINELSNGLNIVLRPVIKFD